VCTAVAYFESNLFDYCASSSPSTLGPRPSARNHSTVMVRLDNGTVHFMEFRILQPGFPNAMPGIDSGCFRGQVRNGCPNKPARRVRRLVELALSLLKITAPAGVT
jgi:hypothetical protein